MDLSKDYFSNKYNLMHPHSEIVEAMPQLKVGKALDLGCGGGRNSLYLAQQGFTVDAWDHNPDSIQKLDMICVNESINTITTKIVDFNGMDFSGQYDLILSTVVLMFLQPSSIPNIIKNMQNATKIGGYNLIVSAMDTDDYPCTLDFFTFLFKPKELASYYDGWTIKKYNEDTGLLHKTDQNGNRIKLRFATLLAQKN
ncbi:tellurite resistance methyltransferase TehB [Commensalibacter papalotli (ex Servin-Garciduenas et al. 2014)]|uniref:Tellurite resistance protein TehB n=1 Tax=Commensalibacter papalotli (ex Servin-Garciduenas et al. 2014) TaxID=1208583 RepID=W7DPZ6_9PROT|nr:tellurite resistance methyltransferase TehB [Commensalibacter papalotli (ex Servin-Garciduenas et al. 2014)]EUK19437.1 tellurite resistance protein TehB [Commensalibacter papalotli (ex Servin-Garciduenas et al. 2014)]